MSTPPADIYIEPHPIDVNTLTIPRGQAEPFHHSDRSTLKKVAEPTPNPLARG